MDPASIPADPASIPAAELAVALAQAFRLTADGDDAAVLAVLCPVLNRLDPGTATADPVLADAALLLIQASESRPPSDREIAWMHYVYRALTTTGGVDDEVAAMTRHTRRLPPSCRANLIDAAVTIRRRGRRRRTQQAKAA